MSYVVEGLKRKKEGNEGRGIVREGVLYLIWSVLAIDSWEGFMEYVGDMNSGAMIYIPSFIEIDSDIQKLTEGFTDIQRTWKYHKPTFIFKSKRSRLKKDSSVVSWPLSMHCGR
jgi:hypothetical protein